VWYGDPRVKYAWSESNGRNIHADAVTLADSSRLSHKPITEEETMWGPYGWEPLSFTEDEMKATAEESFQKGFQEGFEKGEKQGIEKGKEDGEKTGYANGRDIGLFLGKSQGIRRFQRFYGTHRLEVGATYNHCSSFITYRFIRRSSL
jgi:flagellar biosynthesis/type III secretory pathway protein FliH